jgi:uncharacterized membrane protein HdeD (DUF308 family)
VSVQAIDEAVSGTRPPASRALRRIYLVRGIVALVWAGGFAAASGSLSAGAVALLIAYPLIDVAASAIDVRVARASVASLQSVNAGISLVAAIGIAVAGADDTAAVLHVFGAWALVSGAIQVVVAVRRRAAVGTQWAMLLSGSISMVAGLTLNLRATADHPTLGNLIGYAALGGAFFIADAIMLARRAR